MQDRRRGDIQIALLRQAVKDIQRELHDLRMETRASQQQMQSELHALRTTVQVGKNAFWVLGVLGAAAATLLSTWHTILRLLKGG